MQVIGVGLGRTGTLSLKTALEQLGFGPCYHFMELFGHPEHAPLWTAAARGEPVQWDRLLGGYRSTTDWPACTFWRELVERYPHAPVVLTVRDPSRWYDSVRATIYQVSTPAREAPPAAMPPELAAMGEMSNELIWKRTFGGRFEDRVHAIETFERHTEEVRQGVPAERLLVFEVGQGWEPLCAHLGVPVPDEPFPHLNDTASFQARIMEERGPGGVNWPGRGAQPPGAPGRP